MTPPDLAQYFNGDFRPSGGHLTILNSSEGEAMYRTIIFQNADGTAGVLTLRDHSSELLLKYGLIDAWWLR